MKRTTLLLGTAAALALIAPAQAGQLNGWYVGLEGGASWAGELEYLEQATSAGPVTHFHHYTVDDGPAGWAVFATAGYAFGSWRLELEAGYRENKLEDFVSTYVTLNGAPSSVNTGILDAELQEFSLMANVLYDLRLTDRLSASVGAGAGADQVRFEWNNPTLEEIDSSEWSFAYQALAGLNYDLTKRTQLTLRYRYLRVTDPELTIDRTPSHTCCIRVEDIEKHAATLGIRYSFGAAEPAAPPPVAPPPPPPPPPPVKQFTIFFGYNKCDITAEADRVLSDAAAAAKSTGAASVRIVGHTDSSGSNAYNQRLSECRANAAKSNLAGKGVPDGAITTAGRGEGELLVQTGDNVKEPQNRRATVDLE